MLSYSQAVGPWVGDNQEVLVNTLSNKNPLNLCQEVVVVRTPRFSELSGDWRTDGGRDLGSESESGGESGVEACQGKEVQAPRLSVAAV